MSHHEPTATAAADQTDADVDELLEAAQAILDEGLGLDDA